MEKGEIFMDKMEMAKKIYLEYKEKENREYNFWRVDKLEEVSNYIKSGFDRLRILDIVWTRSQIEENIYKRSGIYGPFSREKSKALYQIYATIIGVLDARYDEANRHINRNVDFINKFGCTEDDRYKEEINLEKEFIKLIIEERSNIKEDYISMMPWHEVPIIKDIIDVVPMNKDFDKLCDDMRKNYESDGLHGWFMISYFMGYNNSLFFDYEKIIELYNDLMYEYKIDALKMENNKNKVKELMLSKNN